MRSYRQTNLAIRVDDEDGANRECDALLIDVVQILLVNHIVLVCHPRDRSDMPALAH